MREGAAPSIGIVVSRADSASEHIGEHLLALRDWTETSDESQPPEVGGGTVYRSGPFELRSFEELHLHLDDVVDAFDDVDLVVFASRHSGETGPLLTAHFTGNFGPADYGGSDGGLAEAAPAALDRIVAAFESVAPDGYDVGIECTHHGPSEVGVPSLFAELGSDEPQWEDPAGARAVAEAILSLEVADVPARSRTIVGFGGGHYAPRFTRILQETDWQLGHIAADWGLDALGDPAEHVDVIERAFERSGATLAVVDDDRPDLEAVIEDLGFRVVSETWLRETDGLDRTLVAAVEAELGPVSSGIRFGSPAATATSDDLQFRGLPDELVATALGIDPDRTREAIATEAVAFRTEENGNRPRGRAAFTSQAAVDRLIDELVAVLASKFDSVERAGDEVVANELAFDPAAARRLGVPEGPAFGKLANGQPVEVDGETIPPAAVTEDREHRFPVE